MFKKEKSWKNPNENLRSQSTLRAQFPPQNEIIGSVVQRTGCRATNPAMKVRFLPLPPTRTSAAQAMKNSFAFRDGRFVLWLETTSPLLMENADVPSRLHLFGEKRSNEKATNALRGEGVLLLPAEVAEAGPEQMQFSRKQKWKYKALKSAQHWEVQR